jgi:hypothetical protein
MLTQHQPGDAPGLTPIHVNRVLRELRASGLAHHQRGRISLLTTDELGAGRRIQQRLSARDGRGARVDSSGLRLASESLPAFCAFSAR